jgi:soluble lytic murein transglycosylase
VVLPSPALRTLSAMAVLVLLLGSGPALAPFEAYLESRSPDELGLAASKSALVQPGTDLPNFERHTILTMVREHRRTVEDGSRRELADTIYEEARAENVDPLMIASIVARESSFRHRVVSRAGAVGLMQLRPWVARDLAQRSDIEWAGVETLHNPDVNVRLGILYYKELVERFDGDERMALTAYNYGPSRVSRQVRRGTYRGSRYADRIIQLYEELNAQRTLVASATDDPGNRG